MGGPPRIGSLEEHSRGRSFSSRSRFPFSSGIRSFVMRFGCVGFGYKRLHCQELEKRKDCHY